MPRKLKFQPPYKSGHLDVGDGHALYYECWGNPKGKPLLYLHGGPGAGFSERHKKTFDPSVWNVIFFDQRGAGRSLPFATIENNTTDHLVKDINTLLDFLKIKKVALCGGSWGSTLALVYAIQHKARVAGLFLNGIWLADQESTHHFIGGGVASFFPEAWERFLSLVPEKNRKDIIGYYLQQMQSTDPKNQEKYSYEWCLYEASFSSLKPNLEKLEKRMKKDQVYRSLSPLEAHYIINNCFIPEGYIEKNASKLSGIPTVIVQGRYDMVCPPIQAYKLHKKIKGSQLYFVTSGHSGRDREINKKLLEEVKKFEEIA